jgi:predicted peptidase
VSGRSADEGRALKRALVALLCLGGCATARFAPASPAGYARGFRARLVGDHRYFVALPSEWRPGAQRAWPILVYLHGGGERGDDGVAPTQGAMGQVVFDGAGRLPFIVLFPQARTFWLAPDDETRLFTVIDDAARELGGDPARVYLTGNSMGGYAAWILGARHPGRFAALAPICGGVVPPPNVRIPGQEKDPILSAKDPYAEAARRIGRTPVWAFHGASDWLVPVEISRKMVAALRAAGNGPRYSEYPGVGHEAEERAYREPGLFEWLAAQRLPATTAR